LLIADSPNTVAENRADAVVFTDLQQSAIVNQQSTITVESDANDTFLTEKGTGKWLFGTIPASMLIVQAASECQRSKEGQYAKSSGTQYNDGCDGRPGGTARIARAAETAFTVLGIDVGDANGDPPFDDRSGRTMEAWRRRILLLRSGGLWPGSVLAEPGSMEARR
jgi:hypothetical protein